MKKEERGAGEPGEWTKKCKEKKKKPVCMYLVVDVNSSSNLPTAARDRLQPLVIMVTSCCIGILVVELQSTLGQKSLS